MSEAFLANLLAWTFILSVCVLVFLIRIFVLRRAVNQVIKIFRSNRALSWRTAKTADQLGLTPPDFIARIMRPKDYKPDALKALIAAGVVRAADDGRMCLAEERLTNGSTEDAEERQNPVRHTMAS